MSKRCITALILILALPLLTAGAFGFDSSDFIRRTDQEWIYSGALSNSRVQRVRISAVGDLMVHARQAEDALRRGSGDGYNFDHAFSYIRRQFFHSDIVIGNLETTLAGPEVGFMDYPLFSAPDEFAEALQRAGFNLLSTANNHSLDHGEEALRRTIEVLNSLGIVQVGTYISQEARDNITIIEQSGITFAFLSYTYSTNGIPLPSPYMVNRLDESLFMADIRRARGLADFVIVLPHMGTEYESFTRPRYREVVMSMFRAGADIVLASHPHVVQPAEFVTIIDEDGNERLGFVAYSMGNFISGQRTRPTDAGVIFHLYFERVGDQRPVLAGVSYTPTWVRFHRNGTSLDIAVLSVYDTLTAALWGRDTGLSQNDLNRVRAVQTETTRTISGTAIPIDAIAPEYFIDMGFRHRHIH